MSRTAVFWILLTAVCIRLLQAGHGMIPTVDSALYMQSAQAIIDAFTRGDFSQYHVQRTPGYPLFLAFSMAGLKLFTGNTSVQTQVFHTLLIWLQALLGVGVSLLAAAIAQSVFKKESITVWVGVLTALSPNLLYAEHTQLSETLYAFWLCLFVWLSLRWQENKHPAYAIVLGLVAANTVFTRFVGMLLVLLAPWLKKLSPSPQGFKLAAGAFVVPIIAWISINGLSHGYWGIAASGGINQLYKVVDVVDADSPRNQPFRSVMLQFKENYPPTRTYEAVNDAHIVHWLNEKAQKSQNQIYLEDDRSAGEIAWQTAQAHPLVSAQNTLKQAWQWVWLPTAWDGELFWWMPVFGLGLLGMLMVGLSKQKRYQNIREAGQFGLLAGVLLSHWALYPLLTVSEARYRVPLEPLWIVFAVVAVSLLLETSEKPTAP